MDYCKPAAPLVITASWRWAIAAEAATAVRADDDAEDEALSPYPP